MLASLWGFFYTQKKNSYIQLVDHYIYALTHPLLIYRLQQLHYIIQSHFITMTHFPQLNIKPRLDSQQITVP